MPNDQGPSVKELQKRRDAASKTKRQTDEALELLSETKVPDGAKGEKADLRKALKAAYDRQTERIKELTERIKAKKDRGGASEAIKWAVSENGTKEIPMGSNWGGKVMEWIKFTGYGSPVPWCGCFACYAIIVKGGAQIPSRIRMGYAGYIAADARNGANGFRAVPFDQAQEGDVLVFWGDQHIGLCRGKPSGDSIPTVEGNTSSSGGSQNNGGEVAVKTRRRSDVTVVARPMYP